MVKGMFGGVIPVLERALDIRSLRHNIILSNIANEETPGYRARDIEFQRELEKGVATPGIHPVNTHRAHIPGASYRGAGVEIITKEGPAPGLDGNSVSLEGEMVRLAENTVMYNATASILVKKFQALREAIKEGR